MTSTAKTKPVPIGTPAQPAAEAESPVLTLLRRNWLPLLVAVAVLAGISVVKSVLPRIRANAQEASWELHRELIITPGAFEADSVADTIRRAREDDRIYKWVVLAGVQATLRSGDKDALAKLQPAFQELIDDGAFAGFGAFAGGEGDLATAIGAKIGTELNSTGELPEFANPTPVGPRVKLSLKIGESEVYEIIVGLYDDIAPETCGSFIAAVQAGRLAELTGSPQGFHAAKFAGLAAVPEEGAEPEEPTSLPLERGWGYFNYKGALTTAPKPLAGSGAQDDDAFLMVFDDNLALDGSVTVFGAVIEGAEILEDLASIGRNPDIPAQFGSTVQVVAAEILE